MLLLDSWVIGVGQSVPPRGRAGAALARQSAGGASHLSVPNHGRLRLLVFKRLSGRR